MILCLKNGEKTTLLISFWGTWTHIASRFLQRATAGSRRVRLTLAQTLERERERDGGGGGVERCVWASSSGANNAEKTV